MKKSEFTKKWAGSKVTVKKTATGTVAAVKTKLGKKPISLSVKGSKNSAQALATLNYALGLASIKVTRKPRAKPAQPVAVANPPVQPGGITTNVA